MNEFTRPREESDLVGGGCQIETNKKQYIEMSETRKILMELSGCSVEGTKDK